MMRSLYSAVSALRNHQTRMDVIGNNIANVNTIGFKKSRVTFQDTLNQTLRGASSPDAIRGGTNAMQVGLGMNVATIETVQTSSSPQTTGKNSDLAISGDGYFMLEGGYFTRAGNFDFDKNFNLIRTDNGLKVMGWMADSSGKITIGQALASIEIRGTDDKTKMDPKATNRVAFDKNLDGRFNTGQTVIRTIQIFDSKGEAHDMSLSMVKQSTANQWEVTATIPGATAGQIKGTLTFDSNGLFSGFLVTGSTDFNLGADRLTIKSMQNTSTYDTTSGNTYTDRTQDVLGNSKTDELWIDFSTMTQFSSDLTATGLSQNGYTNGSMKSYSIDVNGVLSGVYTNEQTQPIAQIALATFPNTAGLIKQGENMYSSSNNAGQYDAGKPNTGSRGSLMPGNLEMSNVELASEFTDMITTQRGFQANNRVITVSDSMLEELLNLKR